MPGCGASRARSCMTQGKSGRHTHTGRRTWGFLFFLCVHTFFLRLAGREGDESSGRSESSSLRVESRRARWVRLAGLTMVAEVQQAACSKLSQQQGHAGRRGAGLEAWSSKLDGDAGLDGGWLVMGSDSRVVWRGRIAALPGAGATNWGRTGDEWKYHLAR